jgi:hypothetical protein
MFYSSYVEKKDELSKGIKTNSKIYQGCWIHCTSTCEEIYSREEQA